MKSFPICMLLATATVGTYGLPQGIGPRYGQGSGGNSGGNSNSDWGAATVGNDGEGTGQRGDNSRNDGSLESGNVGPWDLPDSNGIRCRLEWQTIHRIEEIEEERKQCTPYNEEQCDVVRNCQRIDENVCEDLLVEETYTEEECKVENVRSCQKHWQTLPNGDKNWEVDPSTCTELKQTKCTPVEKTRLVPSESCKVVPREACSEALNCYLVQKEKCEIIHTKTPHQITTQKQVRVCNDNLEGALQNSANVHEFGDDYYDHNAGNAGNDLGIDVKNGLHKEEPKKDH